MSDAPHCFVLAGGRGTRFWPLSRRARPKQLLDFTGEGALLAMTLQRLGGVVPPERQWILTSVDLAEACSDAAPLVPRAQVLAEPFGRNTAPAIALAACLLLRDHGDAPFAVLPSDHLIAPGEVFRAGLSAALEEAAADDVLLTFGVRPDRPETGYGYIEAEGGEAGNSAPVLAFREKPDRATAETYLSSGRHLWNSGMFVWRASAVVEGLREHAPEVLAPIQRMVDGGAEVGTPAFATAFDEAYSAVPSISIDYALMERSSKVRVRAADFDWNDVGHWLAMRDLWDQDAAGNARRGDVIGIDAHANVVYGPDRVTALLGVENLVVVTTGDVTMVCAADRAQDVKKLLEVAAARGLDDVL